MAMWPTLDSRLDRGTLVVTGIVTPSPITRAYRVRVTYKDYGVPKVYVVSPKLERRGQEQETPIPHTYEQATPGQERPCLYFPEAREWTPDMALATSVMPWLLSWLVDYELWYATGEWLGGGVHRGSTKGPEQATDKEAA